LQNIFKTEVIKKYPHNAARVAKITTPHGTVVTPAFMPVGTRAFVNQMSVDDLRATGSQIILGGNTYHMLCYPGMDVLRSVGGMHKFMNWSGAMLTDSGGYQVFSLSQDCKICRIDSDGAHFKHPDSGQIIHLTPRSSIEAQKIIGADIIMAFDECTPESGGRAAALAALERTHRWLLESKAHHEKNVHSAYGYRQALFGIIQGGSFRDLREQSAKFIVEADLDGYAVGGEVIGYAMPQTCEIVDWVKPLLPENKICYTMGVGLEPQDLIDVVARGADIFDCVAPTRNARHGALYCGKIIEDGHWLRFVGIEEEHAVVKEERAVEDESLTSPHATPKNQKKQEKNRLLIKKSLYAKDERPIMPDCLCYTCKNYTRAYLHYLFKRDAALYNNLASIHNVYVMQEVCRRMQMLIIGDSHL
jgi:queuine tRNA-ribosyltransferase